MRISLIVPVFNEEQAIEPFHHAVREAPGLQAYGIEIVFINDGSTDHTAERARALVMADSDVMLINLSRNFGKEAALFAGLEYATGDGVGYAWAWFSVLRERPQWVSKALVSLAFGAMAWAVPASTRNIWPAST